MAAAWFSGTASLKKAILHINDIETGKFGKLLVRIVQKLHSREEKSFTEEEEERLRSALNLTSKEIEIVLDTTSYIFEQAAYHNAKPNAFTEQLEKLGLTEDKIEAFVEVWTSSGPSVIEQLRKRSLAPKQLDSVAWQLNLQMAQANKTKMKIPSAVVELGLKNASTNAKERLQLEFTHEELYDFFQQLEDVQTQLDNLSR